LEEKSRSIIASLAMRCTRIFAQSLPSSDPGSAALRSSAAARSSLISTALNATSFTRFWISRAVRGMPGRSIGLICTRIVSEDEHSRISGTMVGLPE
jgi:hypothetical protein